MALISTLTDSFKGGALDTSKWSSFVSTTGTVTFSNAALNLNVGALSSDNYTELDSLASYDLTGSSAIIKVDQVPLQGALGIVKLFNGTNDVIFYYDAGTGLFYAQYHISGAATTVASTTFNAITTGWWKIRESGGTIFWDYGANGQTWTNLGSVATPIAITALSVKLLGYDFFSDATPGSFVLNNFNVIPGANDMLMMFR